MKLSFSESSLMGAKIGSENVVDGWVAQHPRQTFNVQPFAKSSLIELFLLILPGSAVRLVTRLRHPLEEQSD